MYNTRSLNERLLIYTKNTLNNKKNIDKLRGGEDEIYKVNQ